MLNHYLDIDKVIDLYKDLPLTQQNKSKVYINFQNLVINYFKSNFNKNLKIFNKIIKFPYIRFGNTDIFNLLGSDELIIFLFYKKNKKKYKKVLDIGANIGLHSIILSKIGFKVTSYEPDKKHFKILKKNIKNNNSKNIKVFNKAISDKKKKYNFLRILGNTTGSHIKDMKNRAYGKISSYIVESEEFNNVCSSFDLAKIDCEGSEKLIFKNINLKILDNLDCIVEVTDSLSRRIIWNKLRNTKYKIYSQKTGWKMCKNLKDLPKIHSEGSIFISKRNKFTI